MARLGDDEMAGAPWNDAEIRADLDHEEADRRCELIEDALVLHLFDHDLPVNYAFTPEWRGIALRYIAEFIDARDERHRAAASEGAPPDAITGESAEGGAR